MDTANALNPLKNKKNNIYICIYIYIYMNVKVQKHVMNP